MRELSMLLGGSAVPASNGATFDRNHPIGGHVVTRAAAATPADATRAVDAASAAFPAWSATGPGQRRALLNEAARVLESYAPRFTEAMVEETGSTPLWAHINVHLAADMLREAAALTTQIAGELIPSDIPGNLAMAMRQPAGVVVGMAPWNAPIILAARAVATPLACGNTVVLKGSEICPHTHFLLAECFREAGFPPGVVNYLTNAPQDAAEVVEALIAHPATKRVNFTGSTKVGRLISVACARHLKPVVLELGGKAALVVLDDADLEQAVSATAFGAFSNSGQICMSTERIIVDQAIADAFVAQLTARVAGLASAELQQGPLGSVVGMPTVAHCNALIDDALSKGARLVCGGKAENTFMEATLLDGVTPEMRIFHEETFGPVKAIVRVDGMDEAIACANDSEYGLSAAVFGKDVGRALQAAQRIQSGICHVNGPTVHDEPQMPFGGVKASGLGRFGGKAGIAEFTDLRWITVQTSPRKYPF